jgi:hypothetical protein
MKILLDLEGLDTLVDDEVLSLIRNALSGSHQLESCELLHIESVDAQVVESASRKTPARSFLAWIRQQAKRDDPVGDLARDLRADAPKGRVTKAAWLDYLRASNACGDAIAAFREAWREFEGQRT